MTESSPPPYIVRDYCATCGERLACDPVHGARIACHPNEAQYWSEAEPLPADLRKFYQFSGHVVPIQTHWYKRETGFRISHRPLWLYRSPA